MRVVIVGLGVQGKKRRTVAETDVVAVVDPVHAEASHKNLRDVPIDSYDSAIICTPENVKVDLIRYLLHNRKHVLVEKPLLAADPGTLRELKSLAEKNKLALHTAYNHRFEPNVTAIRDLVASGKLGQIYLLKLFYGNGTARDVRNSVWRDQGMGVLSDLGSHLLDLTQFIGGQRPKGFRPLRLNRFENKAYDHVLFATEDLEPAIQIEASLLAWKNHFTIDVIAEKGSAHLDGLSKWGTSRLIVRTRILPSGRPPEETIAVEPPDRTWKLEYDFFKNLCREGGNEIDNDIWIFETLNGLLA